PARVPPPLLAPCLARGLREDSPLRPIRRAPGAHRARPRPSPPRRRGAADHRRAAQRLADPPATADRRRPRPLPALRARHHAPPPPAVWRAGLRPAMTTRTPTMTPTDRPRRSAPLAIAAPPCTHRHRGGPPAPPGARPAPHDPCGARHPQTAY